MRPDDKGPKLSALVLEAARSLAREDSAPTVRELASHANLPTRATTNTVKNLSRAGKLRQARQRRVDYRNRPVAEWEPADTTGSNSASDHRAGHGWVDLGRIVGGWAR